MYLSTVMYNSCYRDYYYYLMKIFSYGVNRYSHYKLIGITELSERLALDFFNSPFSTDTGTIAKKIPPLDELYDGETVSNCQALHFYSYDYRYTEVSTIYGITLNIASFSSSTLVASTIRSQNTAEKEGDMEGGRYNKSVIV